MALELKETGPEILASYAAIPFTFQVDSILRADEIDGGLGGLALTEEPVDEPYVKDYDEDPSEGPARWPERFDVSTWLFLMALDGGELVGGATIAVRTPRMHMLAGREDLAVLWDIRVHPDHRRRGIGTALIGRAAGWAKEQGCTQLKIETQTNNVRACRFYASRGCRLVAIDRHAYAGYTRDRRVAAEVMVIWCLEL